MINLLVYIMTLSCVLILSQDKRLNMPTKFLVTTILKMFSLLIQTHFSIMFQITKLIKKTLHEGLNLNKYKSGISPTTFTAHEAGINELKHFWKRLLFAEHSDNTLQLLGKTKKYDFISKYSSDFNFNNSYKSLRKAFMTLS